MTNGIYFNMKSKKTMKIIVVLIESKKDLQ